MAASIFSSSTCGAARAYAAGRGPGPVRAQILEPPPRNNTDGTFTDVTAAGLRSHSYGMGAAVGDHNNDGFSDLYVTGLGANILYRNNGDGTFTDVTKASGVAGSGWSVSDCFVDYDRNGHLDLIITRYLDWDFSGDIYCGEHKAGYRSYCHPNEFKPVTHLAFHNNGDGTFTDVIEDLRFPIRPRQRPRNRNQRL